VTERRAPSPWRLPVALLLAITAPPLAIAAWILLSGDRREIYWRSWGVKGGLAIAVIGALPLFVVGIAAELGLAMVPGFTPAALEALENYAWPGNVRELQNELQRCMALTDPNQPVDLADLSAREVGPVAERDEIAVALAELGDRVDK